MDGWEGMTACRVLTSFVGTAAVYARRKCPLDSWLLCRRVDIHRRSALG